MEYIDRVTTYGNLTADCSEESPKPETRSPGTPVKKIICRYGRGCTHMPDLMHCEQFWHPPVSQINDESRRSHHICNECGFASFSLQELQLHLKRKTAWSNSSLVGCRISCLIDSKEWHEGYVSQYHRSGKHYVEFRMIGERRWLNMKKIAFYIVERPTIQQQHSTDRDEFKESEGSEKGDGLAPIEENWVYVEDVTLEYAFAQSMLLKIYGSTIQETGHKTKGHTCLTEEDRTIALQMKGSLLYGELLPRGVNKALGPKRMCAQNANSLFDLGMGTGKVAIQAFLQFKNLKYVYGVELSMGRYSIAESAALKLVDYMGADLFTVEIRAGSIQITENFDSNRVLKLVCGDMFDTRDIHMADIVMLETDIPNHLQQNLCHLLNHMHDGARALTYLDLRKIWSSNAVLFPFKQMEINKNLSDRFPTSWSVQRGHHFYLWTKDCKDLKSPQSFSSISIQDSQQSSTESVSTKSSLSTSRCFPFNVKSFFGFTKSNASSSALKLNLGLMDENQNQTQMKVKVARPHANEVTGYTVFSKSNTIDVDVHPHIIEIDKRPGYHRHEYEDHFSSPVQEFSQTY